MLDTDQGLETLTIGSKRILVPGTAYGPAVLTALRSGNYENSERNKLGALLKAGDRVLEVGTAIGVVAMHAADIVGSRNILCFEADPALIEDARRNFIANNLDLHVNNAVLQNRNRFPGPGTSSTFFLHKEFWASSLQDKPGTVGTLEVPNKCLEQVIEDFDANVLICDIEGGEIDLLSSADLSGLDRIMLEIHYWAGRAGINRMIRKIIQDGFSIDFQMCDRSIVVFHRGFEK
jgi:FkbM family methyltransferase